MASGKLYIKDNSGNISEIVLPSKKEIKITNVEPTSSTVSALDNESLVFYETSSQSQELQTPVYTTGNQTVDGVKRFASGLYGNVITLASNSGAIDVTLATAFIKTVTANTTFSFTNVPSGVICCITLQIINGGNYTVTWPNSVKWTDNTAPDLTSYGKDILTFITMDGGTTWFGTTTCIGVTS